MVDLPTPAGPITNAAVAALSPPPTKPSSALMRVLREQPHFGNGIKDQSLGLYALNFVQERIGDIGEFQFRWMKHRLPVHSAPFWSELVINHQRIQEPSVGIGYIKKLFLTLGKGDVERPFTTSNAFQEKLKSESCLTCAGTAGDKIHVVRRKTWCGGTYPPPLLSSPGEFHP
jgi:hypothetical protein